MAKLLDEHQVPEDKRMLLFTYLRLAASFSDYSKRLKCVQARLQSLSVLIYSNQLTDNVQSLLYSGLLEELVEVLEMSGDRLMEIKAAALKALTSIIHPLTFLADYRPFYTIHDVDFKELTSSNSSALPSIILGVTNPFFNKVSVTLSQLLVRQ